MKVLVTGATGYVGGRVVPLLLEAGHEVTVLVRDAARYAGRAGSDQVTVVEGDLLKPETISGQLSGFDSAYYLVHSMFGGADFAERDQQAVENFANAIGDCPHIVYLGGLLPPETVSVHLSSRAAVGQSLEAMLPGRVTEFRAGPVIGSGSASFEMVRYLTERLVVMLTPRWVRNEVQPIAIRDVLAYLEAALTTGPIGVIEIGADRMSFADMMRGYAAERGLVRRFIIPTPFLAPRLAARWVGFVTPISNRLAVPLIEGVVSPVIADTQRAEEHFPQIKPRPYREAVGLALARIEKDIVETRWSDSLGGAERGPSTYEVSDEEGMIREVRQLETDVSPEALFAAFTRLGGDHGWPAWHWAWKIRGYMDQLVGGPGLRRGRRHPSQLREGETVDFWRVERVEAPDVTGRSILRLRAEMLLPGKAWLQWETGRNESGRAQVTQTALFEPRGLPGFLYWYAMFPAHLFIFGAMVRGVAKDAKTHPMTIDPIPPSEGLGEAETRTKPTDAAPTSAAGEAA